MAEERKRLRDEEIVERGEKIGEGLRKFSKTLDDLRPSFARIMARNEALRKRLEQAQDTQNKSANENTPHASPNSPRGP